jgi:hypothetical protein
MLKCQVFVAWVFLLASFEASCADTGYRIQAAKGPYFLCDERVVEDRWLAERFAVPLKKHSDNPLIVGDNPWEGTGPLMGGSVLFDPNDSMYKIWYGVWNSHRYFNKLPFSYNICYAESKDGLRWVKPPLGIFKHEDDPANNCIVLGLDKTQAIDVCLNPRPEEYPGRFLAIHNQKGGVFVSSSGDGKTFTILHGTPAIPYHSDTHNNFVYDDVRDRWLIFCRPRAYAGDHKRRVSFQTSSDLKTWTHDRTVLIPTETETQEFYGMTVFRLGDLFWGMVQVYDRQTGFMHGELAWSGDGEHWSQVATHPTTLERGSAGGWDHAMVIAADTPVTHGDELRFYYGGSALRHDDTDNPRAIGMATAERDRLVGLRPSSESPGYVLTRPLLPPKQGDLLVNTIVSANGGTLRAELRDDGNHVIEGYSFDDCDPVAESGYDLPVTWQGKSISTGPSSEVRICFELANSQAFAFNFIRATSE